VLHIKIKHLKNDTQKGTHNASSLGTKLVSTLGSGFSKKTTTQIATKQFIKADYSTTVTHRVRTSCMQSRLHKRRTRIENDPSPSALS